MSGPGPARLLPLLLPLPLLLWSTGVVLPRTAEARRMTYCVGGYRGRFPDIEETACNTPPIRSQHTRWHHHVFFVRDGVCYDCWDEVDSSCDWDFLQRNPGYERLRNPTEVCQAQDNAGEIIDHVIDGRPDPAIDRGGVPTLSPEAQATTDDGRPLRAGESAALSGVVRDAQGNPRPLEGGRFRLQSPDGTLQEIPGTLQPDGVTVRGTATFPDAETVTITFLPELAALPAGESLRTGDTGQTLALQGAPSLGPLAPLDFGRLEAGASLRDHCQTLDLRSARNLADRPLHLSLAGLAGCEARPLFAEQDDQGRILRLHSLEPTAHILPTAPPTLTFCLSASACRGETAPALAALRLTPEGRPDRAADVPLRWQIASRGWLACHALWLWPTLSTLVLAWLVLGWVRPRRFSPNATITVASDPEGLRRSLPVRLRECRGARPGFYRDARLAVHFDGAVHGRVRGAAALLWASRDGVALLPRGTIETYDRRKRQWKPASSPEGQGHLLPSPAEIFRCGDVCFQIDPG